MIEITSLGNGWPIVDWLDDFDEFTCCGKKVAVVAGEYTGGDVPHTALIDGMHTGIYEPTSIDAAQEAVDRIYSSHRKQSGA